MRASTAAGSAPSIHRCSTTASRPTDQRLAALLENKPSADEVPLEAWWHLAESLNHSVAVRRAREGVDRLDAADLHRRTYQARWSAQAALTHLGAGPSKRRGTGAPGPANVRATIRDLARLVVSARATPLETLRGAILDHLEALGIPAV